MLRVNMYAGFFYQKNKIKSTKWLNYYKNFLVCKYPSNMEQNSIRGYFKFFPEFIWINCKKKTLTLLSKISFKKIRNKYRSAISIHQYKFLTVLKLNFDV